MDKRLLKIRLLCDFIDIIAAFCATENCSNEDLVLQVAEQNGQQWVNITDSFNRNYISNAANFTVEATIHFEEHRIMFAFTTEGYTIGMRLSFDNAPRQSYFTFDELNNIIDQYDFRCSSAFNIVGAELLKKSFNWLLSLYNEKRNHIIQMATNADQLDLLMQNREHDHPIILQRDQFPSKFSDSAHNLMRKGDLPRAVKTIKKIKGELTVYETRLCDFLEKQKIRNSAYEAMPQEIDGYILYFKKNRWNQTEALICLAAFPFAVFFATMLLMGIREMYYAFLNGLYVVRPDFWLCLTFGFFVGFPLVMPIRKFVLSIIFKNDFSGLEQYRLANEDKIGENIVRCLFTIIIVFIIILYPLAMKNSLVFRESEMLDNTKLFSIKSDRISYENVDCVYIIEAFHGSKEDFENPSVAIKLTNGKLVNLRGIGMPEQAAIDFLADKGITISSARFIEDIQ